MVKKQHYISRKLLAHFIDNDGKFFEFLVGKNNNSYATTPNDAMSEMYVYEDAQLEPNAVENFLGREVDSKLPEVIKKTLEYIQGLEVGSSEFSEVKNWFSENMTLFIKNYYRSNALLTEFSFRDSEHKIALLLKNILDESYIELLAETVNACYKTAIIRSLEGEFLLSDQYISTAALGVKSQLVQVSNRNIGLRETVILIPISSEYYFVLWNTDTNDIFVENSINDVHGEALQAINAVIVNSSYRKCLGKKKSVCEKSKLVFQTSFPSEVFSKDWSFTRKKEVFWYEQDKRFWKSFKHHVTPEYFTCGRNDLCLCGSGEKYKKCHYYYSAWWNSLVATFQGPYPFVQIDNKNYERYVIRGAKAIEAPIDSYWKIQ
ncbi:MAG: DUF4238 domain-containing protein [Candidatus Moraniibacteriota bacterium]|nr:MAG: DUF4238 domain-containing protein [Candidatus Moranbacteria bacterium]